jgi:hypothetical protein
MLPQLGTRSSPSRRSPFSPQAGAAYAATPPAPVAWSATMPRPQTSAGMLERQSSREGNLLSPPTMTYDRPLRDRPLTGQVPRRRPRPVHETDLASSPRSTIHPAPKVEAWGAMDKGVHEQVDKASGSADCENERLRCELHSLQAALQHTQNALVDKYRGSGANLLARTVTLILTLTLARTVTLILTLTLARTLTLILTLTLARALTLILTLTLALTLTLTLPRCQVCRRRTVPRVERAHALEGWAGGQEVRRVRGGEGAAAQGEARGRGPHGHPPHPAGRFLPHQSRARPDPNPKPNPNPNHPNRPTSPTPRPGCRRRSS